MADLKTEGNWDRVKGRIRSVWGEITDDDVDRAAGDRQRLAGTIKEKTGETMDSITEKLDKLFANDDEEKSSYRRR